MFSFPQKSNEKKLPQDVFFSWIADSFTLRKTGENEIHFVTFSMPRLFELKQEMEVRRGGI